MYINIVEFEESLDYGLLSYKKVYMYTVKCLI